jgi:type II secretory ATPase GspE/PulE/Tfp pilus assembly ATPase PilB-like protein
VWADAPPLERPVADAVAATLKVLAGHEPKERRGQLTGTFAVQSDGKPRNCRLTVRSAQGGEQLLVQVDSAAVLFKGYDDLGVPKPIAERVGELMTLEKGVLLVSSPRGNGLSTTFDVVVLSCDRLLRDFISIEDAAAPPREIQNVKPVRYDARSGTTPVSVLETAMREYPRGIVTRDLTDKELAIKLLELADDQQMVIISLRANDAVDAVARLLAAGVPQDLLARTLLGSLSQRLVRKLCPKCREQFVPPPDLLAKLKKTAEELPFLQKPSEHGCRLCAGSAYFGRTAIFELASGATLRQAIAKKADPAVLRQAAAKDGLRPMRDEGLRLVLENVTGLEELQRVFATKS